MVPRGSFTQHQLAGTAGHPPGSQKFRVPCVGVGHISADRQCDHQGPHKSSRGDPILSSDARVKAADSLSGISSVFHPSGPHIGSGKHPVRLAQSDFCQPGGVAFGSVSVQGSDRSLQTPSGGCVRHTGQPSSTEVLLVVPLSGGGSSGCVAEPVAVRAPVCLPSSSSDSQSHLEALGGEGGIFTSGSSLAQETLVCRSSGSLSGPTLEVASGQDLPQPGGVSTPGPAVVSTNRLALERGLLREDKFSSKVIATIQASRRDSTNCIYNGTWRLFCT